MRRRAGIWCSALLTITALVGLAGCDASQKSQIAPSPTGFAFSSPFAVARVPAEFGLTAAGQGGMYLPWGDDSIGTAEPYTVLAPEGADASSAEAIVVSVTGFRGYQGGLDQASTGAQTGRADRFHVKGRQAIFTPPQMIQGRRLRWADLLVIHGPDLALRVTGQHATKARLLQVLDLVKPSTDQSRAPTVPAPPPGLHVIGSTDANVAAGFIPDIPVFRTAAADHPAIHGIAWGKPAGEPYPATILTVRTFPGRSASLAAMPGYAAFEFPNRTSTNRRDVGGAPGIVVTTRLPNGQVFQRAVMSRTSWGDVLMVVSTGHDVLQESDLVAVAASTKRTNEQDWQLLVAKAPRAGN